MKGEASMDIRLGIIGFGGMGKYHASIAPEGGVKVVAAADILPEKIGRASCRERVCAYV